VARRSQNAFLKRQKELKRLRKAKEKMAKRQGKSIEDLYTFEGPVAPPSPYSETPADPDAPADADAPADTETPADSEDADAPADEPEAAS
jgi:hypothetical protein